ncbi:hypothetical protein [Paenisporosarcina antarctica]|uniref:DUF4181 domain-containing protein n=1 Tax=Paenisporosarcina antarctica TaxID=417367 RepID=A0A4P6ZUH9_9BACL|nr:hypothetical protein [Paenisporosarcina antarctica]QBP39744.1 hypothetical protein E2636_00580 [Paenisporosarcina antarctica]
MGLFFEKVPKLNSSKTVTVFRSFIVVTMVTLLILAIINDFDFFFIKWLFIAAGISSFVDGIEGYLQKVDKKFYLFNFGFAVLWILFPFILKF